MSGKTEMVPVVKCVCGFEHRLSQERNCERLQIVCNSCFRTLQWRDGKPVARQTILQSGQSGAKKFDDTILDVVREVLV